MSTGLLRPAANTTQLGPLAAFTNYSASVCLQPGSYTFVAVAISSALKDPADPPHREVVQFHP